MEIRSAETFTSSDSKGWNAFAQSHPESHAYHSFEWTDLFCDFYGYENHSLLALDSSGTARGILPLCLGRRLNGEQVLISLPHNAYAGLLADSESAALDLVDAAIHKSNALRAHSLQIRSFNRIEDPRFAVQDHKVHVQVDLKESIPALWKSVSNQLRWEVKKAYRNRIHTIIGGEEYLDQFYWVYQRLERELGIPCHPCAFFVDVLRRFGPQCRIFTSFRDQQIAGSILAISHSDRLELVWGGTLESSKPYFSTPMIFWRAACWAQRNGLACIDFGRSTVGSGVHQFKKKWLAPERTLYYHHYLCKAGTPLPDYSTANSRYNLAVTMWKHLPLALTQTIGNRIIKYFF